MKRTILLLIMLMAVGAGTAWAQTEGNVITGRVLDERGQGLPSATVTIKGASTSEVGALTDLDGNFRIPAPATATLVVQVLGYATREVPASAAGVVRMQVASKELTGAVVTALAIRREKRELGYSATTLNSDEINQGNNTSALSALQGKTAGANITSSTGGPGGSTRIVLRGEKSIGGGNNALIVVDGVPINNGSRAIGRAASGGAPSTLDNVDFGNRGNDINPEDIENITVLKGPAAAALYGSAGANGAVMITTKSGRSRSRGNKKTEVTYSTSYTLSNVLKLPDLQNTYGQGNLYDGLADDRRENFSWGERMDGSLRPWGQIINGQQLVKPYAPVENNMRSFFNTGQTWENNASLSGGTENSSFYLSLNTLNNKGVTPATFFDKYSIRFNGSSQLTNNFYASVNVNYLNINARAEAQGQGAGSVWDNVLQTPRDIPLREARNYNNPYYSQQITDSTGINRYGYFNNFAQNPYWVADNYDNRNRTDRILGNFIVGFRKGKINVFNRLGGDIVSDRTAIKEPVYNSVPFEDEKTTGTGYGYTYLSQYPVPSTGGYREININSVNLYNDLIAQYTTPISDVANFNLLLGNSIISNRGTTLSSDIDPTNNGLVIPNYYNFSNASGPVITDNTLNRDFTIGLYAQARLDYKNTLFLDITGRNDWSSTLAPGNRSFFYPSVSASWVITESFKDRDFTKRTLNYAKVRASYASVGKGAAAYQNNDPAYVRTDFQPGFGTVTFPFNGVPGYSNQPVLGNPQLRPERTNAFEVGLELALLQNRITFEATYYTNRSIDQIVTAPAPPSTGYTGRVINLGDMTNKGIELTGRVIPVRSASGFRWELYGTYTKNKNEVTRLPEGTSRVSLGGASGIAAYAAVGQPYGAYYGESILRNNAGQVVVDSATGLPLDDPNQVFLGSFQPKFQASWGTTISYKGISLNVLFDTKQGGKIYSSTRQLLGFAGISKETENRDDQVYPNSVYLASNGQYVKNTTEYTPYFLYVRQIAGLNMVDASYVKLREASISYTIPQNLLKRTPFGNLVVGAFGNNLFIWTASENKYVDPEVGTGGATNLQGFDFRARPSLRNYGFRLSVTF
jgi:TonB-linked SusC/RagA family outer membrane protein